MDDVKADSFISLHNHTTFSLLDSLIKPIELFKKAKELGQEAIAVTDHGTLAGMWDALQASRSTGVKLITGCEFYFVDDVKNEESRLRHLILLAKNEVGYKNLLLCSAEGFDNSIIAFKRTIPRIDWGVLEKYSEGLICLTACSNGILGQLINQKKFEEAENNAARLKTIFGDNLGIELQAHALKRVNNAYSGEIDQQFTNDRLKEIADKLDIRCVVTTDAHYLTPDQNKSHDVLLAIASGNPVDSGSRLRYQGTNGILSDFYVKSGDEVFAKLERQYGRKDPGFARKCIDNTKYFADLCETPEWVDPKFSNPTGKELPEFPVQDQYDYREFKEWLKTNNKYSSLEEDKSYLRYRCEIALEKEFPNNSQYRDRLEVELDVLYYCGVSSYMLLVFDIIDMCKRTGIPHGPGRGSVGGSLVAYLLGIHKTDPIKYGLVFERFHSKLKKDYSDIDIDVSTKFRDRVIDYVVEKYGKDNVASISNYNTLTPKVYARAIARAFVYGGDRKAAVKVGNLLADSIPADMKTVSDALEKASLFAEYAKPIVDNGGGYVELKEYAEDIGGQVVAVSTHAAGIIVNKRPLRGLVPLRRDKDGKVVIESEKNRAESLNLVKLDILGLSTLDIIHDTYELIKQSGKKLIPFDYNGYDKKTYDLISTGDTLCVFQFGTSAGTVDLCKRYVPQNMEDLAIITTIARPASKEIRGEFFKVKNGEKPMEFLHPLLERSLKNTFGFALYDESLLILTSDIAGWSLTESDSLRKFTKAKGKNPEKEKQIREKFILDSTKEKLTLKEAEEIWTNVIEPFAKYSFNKSHAVEYSFLSYETAFLKANYPLEFLVTNLKHEVNSNSPVAKDNVVKIKEEIKKLNVKIVPPDVNRSHTTYTIIDDNTLLTGLDALKYIGKDAIPEILAKRPFVSFEDFLTKLDSQKVRAPAIQALAASGCLDSFGLSRKLMFLYAADYKKKLGEFLKKQKKDPETFKQFNYPWPEEEEWSIAEKCALERFYIGESLSGNKVEEFNGFFTYGATPFTHFSTLLPKPDDDMTAAEQRKYTKHVVLVQAEVKNIFEFKVKKEDSKLKGEVMAKVTLEDPHGNQMTMTCFPDGWVKLQNRCLDLSNHKHKLEPGVGLYINGNLNWYDGDISIIFEDLAKFSPPPQLPTDLDPKKVKLTFPRAKTNKAKPELKEEEELDRTILLSEVEEDLINSGHADLDDEEDD